MEMDQHPERPPGDPGRETQRELPPGPEAPALEGLRAEMEEAQRETAQFRSLLQRVQADFANYRKRVEEEQRGFQQSANSGLILRLLPVLDDLERALATLGPGPEGGADPAWVEGVRLIGRKFRALLESEGVQPVEAEGKPFDPWEHEVVSYEETTGSPPGVVTGVVRQGYRLAGRVIRPALVTVARAPRGEGGPSAPATGQVPGGDGRDRSEDKEA